MITDKDYSRWITIKSVLNAIETPVSFCEREVWWASLGENIGFELDGKSFDYSRPIVILKAFGRNNLFYVPLTTTTCERKKSYFFDVGEVISGKQSKASLSHTSSMDARRLLTRIGLLEQNLFDNLQEAIKVYIFS